MTTEEKKTATEEQAAQIRNFLLRSYYGEKNEHRRAKLQQRIDTLNARMRVKGNNLLDT